MLRSRSSSLLPITNAPLTKSPPSFSGGRRPHRSRGCFRCGSRGAEWSARARARRSISAGRGGAVACQALGGRLAHRGKDAAARTGHNPPPPSKPAPQARPACRPLLALLALSVLCGGGWVFLRPRSLPSSRPATDLGGFGGVAAGEAAHRRRGGAAEDAHLDSYHAQQVSHYASPACAPSCRAALHLPLGLPSRALSRVVAGGAGCSRRAMAQQPDLAPWAGGRAGGRPCGLAEPQGGWGAWAGSCRHGTSLAASATQRPISESARCACVLPRLCSGGAGP